MGDFGGTLEGLVGEAFSPKTPGVAATEKLVAGMQAVSMAVVVVAELTVGAATRAQLHGVTDPPASAHDND